MGIFSSIKDKIFGSGEAQAAEITPETKAQPAPVNPAPAAPAATATTTTAPPASKPAAASAATPATVDVAAVLTGLASKSGQKLDWRKSIVDLLKLLDLDSSLTARKDLAKELGYAGDTGDSATMNIWLHKAVMKKLAENGGKVPADLKD